LTPSDRHTSCAKWHPGVPSDFTTWAAWGRYKARVICRLCKRIRYRKNYPTSKERPLGCIGKPYGVIPLKWTPPEEIEHVSYC